MANVASAAIEFTEVPPVTVPTVNVVLGNRGVCNSAMYAIALPMAWIAEGRPKAPKECPPGPEKINSKRRLPVPPAVIRLRRTPSTEINPSTPSRSRNRALTPRRSPRPSSPTLPLKIMLPTVSISNWFITSITDSNTARPRVSSPIPGA